MSSDISRKIIRNTAFNTLGRFWGVGVSLLLTPYIVHRLGSDHYGIWTIVLVITGYFGLLDFGVSSSFTRYISAYYAKKNFERINQVINTGFSFYFVFGALLVLASLFCTGPIFTLFKISPASHQEALFVFFVCVVIFAASGALSVFASVQAGLQRMDVSNKLAIGLSLVNVAGTIYFLEHGWGLVGLVLTYALVFILQSVCSVIVAFRLLPELRFNPLALVNRSTFRMLFLFGFRIQLAKISSMVTSQIDKIYIAAFLSVGLVTYYQLGSSVVMALMSLCGLLVSALMPAFTEIEARGDRKTLISAYIRGTKYMAFVAIPAFLFLILSSYNLMALWMSSTEYSAAVPVMQILALGFMVNLIAQVGSSMCVAIEKPQFMASGSLVIIVINALGSLCLARFVGFRWVALGTTAGLIIGTLYFIKKLNETLQVSSKDLLRTVLPFLIISCLAAVPASGINLILDHYGFIRLHRLYLAAVLAGQGVIFSGLYLMGVRFYNLISSEDLSLFKVKLPSFFSFTKA